MGDPGYFFCIIKYSYPNNLIYLKQSIFKPKNNALCITYYTHTHSKGCIGGFLPYGYFDNIN
ncbi:MAG: hypothetical protein COZ08_00895, partial [Bacteroidetes bacterium CG_4_10_14_3_um_filter_42_6]